MGKRNNAVSNGSSEKAVRKAFKKITNPSKTNEMLNLAGKLQVIDLLKKGQSERSIAALTGVSKSQVRIQVPQEKLQQLATDQVFQSTAKVMVKQSKFPEIDEAVYKWFCEMRNPQKRCKPLPTTEAASAVGVGRRIIRH